MSTVTIGIICIVLLLILIMLKVHIGVALMLMSVVGIFWAKGNMNIAISILGTTAFSAIRSYTFGVIPLFVLMGLCANVSGASVDLFAAADALTKKIKGGLGIATVIANAVFAAITGVSVASAAVFTKIALPPMVGLGYDKKFAVGTVAGSSVLGMLIPPSVLMIVYGMLTQESIGSLFLAGVLPGVLLAGIYAIGISIMVRVKPELINTQGKTAAEIDADRGSSMKAVIKTWPMIAIIVITLGGIWGGFFTPCEAGGIGAFLTFVLMIFKKKFTFANVKAVLSETCLTTGSILFLLISAQMYSRMLAISGVVALIGRTVTSLPLPPIVIIIIFMLILIAFGCILDSTSILLLTMPLMYPIVKAFGMNGVWFGIVAIIAIETGLLTPPFGLSVFTVKSSLAQGSVGSDMTIVDIFSGSMPFLLMMFLCLALIVAFPPIATALL